MDLRKDRRGRVPFAVIGVLVLLSASGAGVYLGALDSSKRGQTSAGDGQAQADRVCRDELARIRSEAESAAVRALSQSMAEGSRLTPDSYFTPAMEGWFSGRYPRGPDDERVNAKLVSCILLPSIASLPSVDGTAQLSAPWEAEYLLEAVVECGVPGARRTLRETVAGRVPARELFCEAIASSLASSAMPGGKVDATARAMLSLLAEKRLAEGWGAGTDLPGVASIIAPGDARKAYEVALRAACVEACGVDPANGERIGARYDAGDIFLSEMGETELDTSLILAQSLSGMLDQLLIKYYDYLSLAGGLSSIITALEGVAGWLESVWDRVTGDGTEEAMASAVEAWIRDLAEKAGLDPSLLDLDVPVHLTDVFPEERTFTALNADGEVVSLTLDAPIAVDLLPYDLLSDDRWAELFPVLSDSFASGAPSLSGMLDALIEGLARSGASSVMLTLDAYDSTPALQEVAQALRQALSDASLLRTAVLNAAGAFLSLQGSALSELGAWMEANAHWMGDDNERARESIGISASRLIADTPPDGLDAVSRDALEAAIADAVWQSNGTSVENDYAYRIQDRLCLAAERISSACVPTGTGTGGWLVERLVGMVLEGAPGLPAFSDWLDERVSQFGGDFVDAVALSGADAWVEPSTGRVVVSRWSGEEDAGAVVSASFAGLDALSLTVSPPTDCPGSVHYTSPTETSPTPYTNVWQVNVAGNISFQVSAGGAASSAVCALSSSLDIRAASLWSLDGVDYTPTSTLGGDALAFVLGGFKDLLPVLTRAFEGAREIWELLQVDIVPWLMTKGATLVEKLAALQLALAGDLQELLRSAASKALALVIEALLSHIEDATFEFSLHGLPITLRTLPAMPGPKRFLTLETHWTDGGTTAIVCAELLDLGNDSMDLVFQVDASGPSGHYSLSVDPLMELLDAMVSLRGVVNGLGFDVVLPVLEQHRTLEISLQDIPGLGPILSNIRIPNLGISADIDAGFTIDYAPPSATHVVVNEYEANPPVVDAGNETIELYNPLPVEVCIDGWTVETMCGKVDTWELSGSISPFSVINVTFPTRTLDNDGDGVILRNANGNVIDETPVFRDETNSGKDWQREHDGWGRWVWAKSSLGRPQGAGDFNDSLVAPIWEALKLTLNETVEELKALESYDADAVMGVVKSMLARFEDRVASIIEGQVRKAALFVDILIQDLSGSGGMGYRLEIALDGQGCALAFRWLAGEVKRLLGLASDPGDAGMAFSAPSEIIRHVTVSVSNLVELETPAELPGALAGASLPTKLQGRETISFGLPLIGKLADRDWGPWVVTAGVRAMDFPAQAASLIAPVDGTMPVELWLVRAVFYEA